MEKFLETRKWHGCKCETPIKNFVSRKQAEIEKASLKVRPVNVIDKLRTHNTLNDSKIKELEAQVEELTVKLGKEDEAKDQAGEEQAPEETDLKDQVSSFISDQVKPREAQPGEGMHQGMSA